MKTLSAKLKSKSGVSAVLALVLFLVAAMVCVTMLTAVGTVLKRSKQSTVMTENALALESAALLIRRELDEVSITKITTGDQKGENPRVSWETGESTLIPELMNLSENAGFWRTEPEMAFAADENTPLANESFKILADELPFVTATCELYRQEGMTDTYELVITLTAEETEDTMFMDFLITCQESVVEKDRNGQELTGSHLGVTMVTKEIRQTCTCRFQRTENTKDGARGYL